MPVDMKTLQGRIMQLEARLNQSERMVASMGKLNLRAREHAVFWQGKFAMVKHENNALRRELYRQNRVLSAPPRDSDASTAKDVSEVVRT